MNELPQYLRIRHGQVDQSHEMTTGWLRFSPSFEAYHPTTNFSRIGYDVGLVGTGEGDYEAGLKRVRLSVDSVDSADKKKIMEMDTAHLYFGLFDGGGPSSLVDPSSKFPLSDDPPVGQPVKGLPFRIQKLHCWGYQGSYSDSSKGFASGPEMVGNSYGPVANSKIKEYSFYALATSPVLVNNVSDPNDPLGESLTSKNEYQEHSNGVEKEWIERFEESSDATTKYPSRVIIGGAPLTKLRVCTGLSLTGDSCDGKTLVARFCDVYVAYPSGVDDVQEIMTLEKIEFLDPRETDCGPSASLGIVCDNNYAEGTNCISDILDKLDCICSALTGMTGSGGSPLFPDCCSGVSGVTTTTTTPDPCDPDGEGSEVAYLEDGVIYEIQTDGVRSCKSGATIRAEWVAACEAESTLDYLIGYPAGETLCDCLASVPTLDSGSWYYLEREEGVSQFKTGADIMANWNTYCPCTVGCGPVIDPSTVILEPDSYYKFTYNFCAGGGDTTATFLGSEIIANWTSSKFFYTIICGPFATFAETDAC